MAVQVGPRSIRVRLSVYSLDTRRQGVPTEDKDCDHVARCTRYQRERTEVEGRSATYVSGPGGVSLDLCENLTTRDECKVS